MQARRGTALLLSGVLGLFLLTATHAAAQPRHVGHAVAVVGPAGVDIPHSWRSAPDDAVSVHSVRPINTSIRSDAATTVRNLTAVATRTPHARGPPGSLA
jgi:hypothetical protein